METWRLSAVQVADLVRSKQITAHQVAQQALDRVDSVNPELNAIVECRHDEVLAAAAAIDKRIAAGEDVGPLGGVPVTVKVITDQVGYATTNGVTLQQDCIATQNSPVVENILNAGAVVIGRSNTPAFSYRWFTNNKLHGATRNPHDPGLTPGGSSGGAGSAVASGMGNIALGTDIAGSVRYPAYACGVHGLRPTTGRVPAYNTTTGERSVSAQLMSVTGPLARTVGDLRLALEVMSAGSYRDPFWVPAPLQGPSVPRKVAMCLRPDGLTTAPEIIDHLRKSAASLAEAGWDVTEIDQLPPLREAVELQIKLWLANDYEKQMAAAEQEGDLGALTVLRGQRDVARSLTLASFSDALNRRASLMRIWQTFLHDYPVILMPVSGELPFADDLDLQGDAAYKRVWEAQMPQIGIPLLGLPGLSVCTGKVGRSPVGVQLVAARFREDLCLAAGEDIEARGWKPEVVPA